ncbi:hypothetical protein GCM10020000_78730 [Streptomyces olivoverticillatus]
MDSYEPAGTRYVSCQIPSVASLSEQPTPTGQVEAAVALTVLYEPVLLSLRHMAHAEESARRF